MDEYVRDALQLDSVYKFNDLTDHDIDVSPAVIWEELQAFNCDVLDSKLSLRADPERRAFFIESTDETAPFMVKTKFHALDSDACEGEEGRLRLKFVKKRGSLAAWYDVLKLLSDYMDELLLAPVSHQK